MRKEREEKAAWELSQAQALGAEEIDYSDGSNEAISLLEGRIKREKLKQALFGYIQHN